MRKFSQITEGLWTDIVRRGTTGEVRKEDDVNSLSPREFKDYLANRYDIAEGYSITFSETWIDIPLLNVGKTFILSYFYISGILGVNPKFRTTCKKEMAAIEDRFTVKYYKDGRGVYDIEFYNKSDKCDNKLVVDIIDTIIEVSKKELLIKKRGA